MVPNGLGDHRWLTVSTVLTLLIAPALYQWLTKEELNLAEEVMASSPLTSTEGPPCFRVIVLCWHEAINTTASGICWP